MNVQRWGKKRKGGASPLSFPDHFYKRYVTAVLGTMMSQIGETPMKFFAVETTYEVRVCLKKATAEKVSKLTYVERDALKEMLKDLVFKEGLTFAPTGSYQPVSGYFTFSLTVNNIYQKHLMDKVFKVSMEIKRKFEAWVELL